MKAKKKSIEGVHSEFAHRGNWSRLGGLLAAANKRGNCTKGGPEGDGKSEGVGRCGEEEQSMGS